MHDNNFVDRENEINIIAKQKWTILFILIIVYNVKRLLIYSTFWAKLSVISFTLIATSSAKVSASFCVEASA